MRLNATHEKFYSIFAVIILWTVTGKAQSFGTIPGLVSDKVSSQTLGSVTVTLKNQQTNEIVKKNISDKAGVTA